MAEIQIRAGKITRVVHVRFAASDVGNETDLEGCDGYGILQGVDGRDIFFVDTALQDANLTDLEAGHDALYIMETGPLVRAAKVWVATSQSQILDQAGETRGRKDQEHAQRQSCGS